MTTVEYKGKRYVVASIFMDCGGNVLRVFIVRTGGCVKLRWAKELWDEQVNELVVVRSWRKYQYLRGKND